MGIEIKWPLTRASDPGYDINPIISDASLSNAEKAKQIAQKAGIYKSGYLLNKSLKMYKKALHFAEKAKDQELISYINNEMGELYYFYSPNSVAAINCFQSAVDAYGFSTEITGGITVNNKNLLVNARDAQINLADIRKWKHSDISVTRGFKNETGGKRSEFEIKSKLDATTFLPKADITQYLPVNLLLGYKNMNFNGTKDINPVFIEKSDLGTDPFMPQYVKDLADRRYPKLKIRDADVYSARLNYEIPTFDGLFGSLPETLTGFFPKYPLLSFGFGVEHTRVHATAFNDYELFESIRDFEAQNVAPETLRTTKYTLYLPMELCTITLGPDTSEYSKTHYATILGGGEISKTVRHDHKHVYSIEENGDKGKHGPIWANTWSAGLRWNFPKLDYKFNVEDWAARPSFTFRWQTEHDQNIDSENCIWPLTEKKRTSSLHFGLNHEFSWLVGEEGEKASYTDKTRMVFSIPLSLQFGLNDIGKDTGRENTAYYWSVQSGIKYRGFKLNIGYSESSNGITEEQPNYEDMKPKQVLEEQQKGKRYKYGAETWTCGVSYQF